jgi:LysM repeat protein
MKRVFFVWMTLALCSTPLARAQDAATQERLDKISGVLADLTAGQEALNKRLNELSREVEAVREQASKPTGNWATQEQLNRLAKDIEVVDHKRVADSELVQKQLERLRKAVETPLPTPKPKPIAVPKEPTVPDQPTTPQKGVEHVIKPGETLSGIVAACREQKIKVTRQQILDANPGLKPDLLIPGKKIFIPAMPQP